MKGVLDTPGVTSPIVRNAVKEQAAYLSGTSQIQENVPVELEVYIRKVALHAYKVTDRDFVALRAAGYDEDAIFEITLSIALGAAMTRLEQGLRALEGNADAS
jgi:hypothetical protein